MGKRGMGRSEAFLYLQAMVSVCIVHCVIMLFLLAMTVLHGTVSLVHTCEVSTPY